MQTTTDAPHQLFNLQNVTCYKINIRVLPSKTRPYNMETLRLWNPTHCINELPHKTVILITYTSSEGPDEPALMRRLVCACAARTHCQMYMKAQAYLYASSHIMLLLIHVLIMTLCKCDTHQSRCQCWSVALLLISLIEFNLSINLNRVLNKQCIPRLVYNKLLLIKICTVSYYYRRNSLFYSRESMRALVEHICKAK